MKLDLDIWSDIACPWCWIGKRHLEAALADFAHANQVEIRWRSFELDPSAERVLPPDPPFIERLARKYGTTKDGAQQMVDRMTSVAAGDGLDMRFDRIRPGNTFDAHRLLHLAHESGHQNALKERLFRAYLHEGRAIGERDVLCELAVEQGLDEPAVVALLEGDAMADRVRADEAAARSIGVTGVPFFVAGQRFGVSGAQPAEILHGMLDQAWNAVASSELSVEDDGASCGPTGCD